MVYGMTDSDLYGIIADVAQEAAQKKARPWQSIFLDPDHWSLKEEDFWSTKNMSDEEIRQTIIEDLLHVTMWEREGKCVRFHRGNLLRFVKTPTQRRRVRRAMKSDIVTNLTHYLSDGQIRLNPTFWQEAMDYCGVYMDGFVPDMPADDSPVLVINEERIADIAPFCFN